VARGCGGAVPEVADTTGDGDRRSRLLRSLGDGGGGRSAAVAAVSTVVFVAVIAVLVVRSPGWDEVKQGFFSWDEMKASFPEIAHAFLTNIKIFLMAESIVLVAALIIALLRSLQGPVFFPLRLFAIVYADVFRGIPTLLLVYLLGFGVPALQIPGMPNSPFFWGVIALSLVYTAYVSEVYRAGIESIHPSQEAAARSLGLSRSQAMRHVVLPQAVRRVIPPLLNDFIGLQKDTVLVSFVGVVEIFRQSQIRQAGSFNFTTYLATALVFLVVTIPLARLVDWMLAREKARRTAGGRT
jgi:polar amino acid transport system permease protein